MAEDILQIDYDQMEQIANQFQTQADVVEQMLQSLNQPFYELQNEGWIGEAADAFFQEYETEIQPALNRLAQALHEGTNVSFQIIDVLSQAEEEAAAQFTFEGANDGKGFWNGFKDFFHGMYLEGEDMVKGIWTLVTDPVGTAKGLWHGITHPKELWEAIKQPYVDDWNNGHPWRAIGRGTMAIVTTVLGTKGADKAAKALKGATVVDDVARAGSSTRYINKAGQLTGSVDEIANAILRESSETVSSKSNLISELAENGIKHSPDEIVAITKDANGRVVFLETGRLEPRAAGLQHILADHADDFARKGIPPQDVPNALMNAIENGNIVGHQGRGTGRPIYEVKINGETHRIAITIGDNGYIVGANPTSLGN